MQDGMPGGEPPQSTGSAGNDAPADGGGNAPAQGRKGAERERRKAYLVTAFVAAAAVFTGVGFGAASLIRSQITTASASVIPSPPAANQTFVEDDDGTGADSQENILQSTVPGMVRLASAKGSGAGVVLTPSGLVLTSAQVTGGASRLTARMLPSGHAYQARVVGYDAARGLALVQLQGGGTFKPVVLGNSADFAVGAAAIAISTSPSGKAFTLDIGNVDTMNPAATADGHRLTGLMQTSAQFVPGQGAGGPVVNLSGQVMGIDLTGAGHGTGAVSYAVPIDQALTVARQLQH